VGEPVHLFGSTVPARLVLAGTVRWRLTRAGRSHTHHGAGDPHEQLHARELGQRHVLRRELVEHHEPERPRHHL
jgi:hypothetical protein